MYCYNCGNTVEQNDAFCKSCGAVLTDIYKDGHATEAEEEPKKKRKRKPTADTLMKQGSRVSENIVFCEDGKYRWRYDMSLFKNPTVFILVWKILFFVVTGIILFTMLVDVFSGDMDLQRFLETLKFYGFFLLGMTALVLIGFLIYAAMMGGKYCVLFEMDENGILHKQVQNQAKKAKKAGRAALMTGLARGSYSTAAAGMAGSRTQMYSDFASVRKVIPKRWRELIKINSLLNHNQVYVKKEDFDFVYSYICEKVRQAKKEKEKQ